MGTPSLAYSGALTSATGGTLTSTVFTPATGDIIVVKAVTENAGYIITSTPTGGGWTYTVRPNDHFSASWCQAAIWTAPVTAGGTAQTVSLVGPTFGGAHWMLVVELWRGGQLAATPATCDSRATGAPSVTLTTAANGSVVTWCNGDWAAAAGTAAYRSSATQTGEVQVSTVYSAYSAYQSAATAGAQTVGMTAPAGQTYTLVGVEIEGASTGSGSPSSGVTVTPSCLGQSAGAGGSGSTLFYRAPPAVLTSGTAQPASFPVTEQAGTQPGDWIFLFAYGGGDATSCPGFTAVADASNFGVLLRRLADGTEAGYTWSVAPGTLPAGLSLDPATGIISGTPSGTGTSSFTAQVTDGSGATATRALSITTVASAVSVTTASLPGATDGTAYSAALAAAGGTGTGYTWSVALGALPSWASMSSSGVISGTPSGTGTVNFTVRVTDSGSNTATRALSITTVSSGSAVPVGPSGAWTLVFEDLFDGTSLNTANWVATNGITNSGTTTKSSSVSVSGGYARIVLAGMLNSHPSLQGWGANPSNGPQLAVGDCVEASISFPGPSGDATYNWPAWWASGASWPANGEEDIFEGYNGIPSALNYHSPSGANNGPFPSGSWMNSFHTYTLVRGSGTNGLKCYWDGVLVRQVTPNDSGGPQSLILFMANGGGTANSTAQMLVAYVRMWTPG